MHRKYAGWFQAAAPDNFNWLCWRFCSNLQPARLNFDHLIIIQLLPLAGVGIGRDPMTIFGHGNTRAVGQLMGRHSDSCVSATVNGALCIIM